MTIHEALNELELLDKPYEKVDMPQPTFSNTIKNIRHNLSKPKTIHKFMARFGYTAINNDWTLTK